MTSEDRQARTVQSFAEMENLGMDRGDESNGPEKWLLYCSKWHCCAYQGAQCVSLHLSFVRSSRKASQGMNEVGTIGVHPTELAGR